MSHVLVDMPKEGESHGHLWNEGDASETTQHDFIMYEIDGY